MTTKRLSDHYDACPRCGKLIGRRKDGTYRAHKKDGKACLGVPITSPYDH